MITFIIYSIVAILVGFVCFVHYCMKDYHYDKSEEISYYILVSVLWPLALLIGSAFFISGFIVYLIDYFS